MFEGYQEKFNEEVRLVILKALNEEPNHRLNESLLMQVLTNFAMNRTREHLRTQLRWLADQASAIKITEAGSVLIAELTQAGAEHLERVSTIEGVKKPSLPRG